jgi:creatinine amidohydrolase
MNGSSSRRSFLTTVTGLTAAGATRGLKECQGVPLPASGVPPGSGYLVNPRRVLLWECTRREIRERLEAGRLKAAIVPTGSTEQHNEHLAMIQDTASAVLVAQLAALQVYPQAIVSTPVPVGISPYWMERKGTLTLREETFLAMVLDICESLRAHGIKAIFIVNGHGGNDKPLKSHLGEFRSKLGASVEVCSYWEAYTSTEAIRREVCRLMETGADKVPGHSGEFETSFALAAFPERVHREGIDYEKVHLALKDPQDAKEDRSFYYDSLRATSEKGEALIQIAVDWVANRLRAMIASS